MFGVCDFVLCLFAVWRETFHRMSADPSLPAAQPGFGLGTAEVKRRHILPKALLVGLVAGLLASAFRELLQWAEVHRIACLQRLSPLSGLAFALGLGAVGGGIGLWRWRRCSP